MMTRKSSVIFIPEYNDLAQLYEQLSPMVASSDV